MAGSLDELIEFLLEEIALGGETGLTFLELATRVQQFYQQPDRPGDNTDGSAIDGQTLDILGNGVLDRPFLSKVWTWLARHPDVSIGKNREFNNTSLDEIESTFPGYTSFLNRDNNGLRAALLPSDSLQQQNDPDAPDTVQSTKQDNTGPNLYVNEARMSIAICGHPPDPARVFPSEWTLLSCIAAARREGILQGELVRISAQDKRSVPKRTDVLHEKGYITKKIIYVKGNKTSRLYLRRYVGLDQQGQDTGAASLNQLTVRHIVHRLFDVLKNNPLIAHEDLGDALGMNGTGRARVLSQLIRHLSKIGCLKRVKTAFGPSARSKDLKHCIQYLKEPDDTDMQKQTMEGIQLDQPVDKLVLLYENEAQDSNVQNTENVNDMLLCSMPEDDAAEELLTEGPRLLFAQWNPDRILANVLFEVAREAGFDGMTNASARNIATGPFIKRTLESLLVKLSHRTLQAQPVHLRHLSILRVQQHHNGVSHYLHYTFDTFVKMISNRNAKWSDVLGGEQFQKDLTKAGFEAESAHTCVPHDVFGFVVRTKPMSQVQGGAVPTLQLLLDAKVKNIQPRAGEPSLQKSEPGQLKIGFQKHTEQGLFKTQLGRSRGRPRRDPSIVIAETMFKETIPQTTERIAADIKKPSKIRKEPKPLYRSAKHVDEHGQVITGRPRKFTRGTEKYWRDVFAFIIEERDPSYFKHHGKTGIMNDPGALQIFHNRPPEFDRTLVQVLEVGLPAPAEPRNISQGWINSIKTLMDRSQPGVYISPPGYQPGSRRRKALTLIFRSSRLRELDWTDRHKCWPWQYLSSSASHSLRYQKFYPRLGTTPRHVVASLRLPKSPPEFQSNGAVRVADPPRSVVSENVQLRQEQTDPQVTCQKQKTPEPQQRIDAGHLTDATESDEDLSGQACNVLLGKQSTIQRASLSDGSNVLHHKRVRFQPTSATGTDFSGTAASTRSTRKRKPTKKALENLVIQGLDFRDTDSTSRTSVAQAVSSGTSEADVCMDLLAQPLHDTPLRDVAANMLDTPTVEVTEDANQGPSISSNPTISDKAPCSDVHEVYNEVNAVPLSTVDNTGANDFLISPQGHTDNSCTRDVVTSNTRSTEEALFFSEALHIANADSANVCPEGAEVSNLEEPQFTAPVPSLAVTNLDAESSDMPIQEVNTVPRKRRRGPSEQPEFSSDVEEEEVQDMPTPKRVKTVTTKSSIATEITRAQVSKLCRIMVLELVGLCSGLAPNVPWTLRRAMIPRWQEAEVKADQLNAKNVRAAIKALCENGKLKQITFAARGKAGAMLKMSIVALRGMDATSPAVLDLQKKMLEAEPADYVPPEFDVESRRLPSEMNKKRYSKEIGRDGSSNTAESPSTTPKASQGRRKKPKQIADVANLEDVVGEENEVSNAGEATCSPSQPLEMVPLLNTGFLTLKVPRLKELDVPPNSQYVYKPPTVLSHSEVGPVNTVPVSAGRKPRVAQRNGSRHKRSARFDPETHRLIWKKPKVTKLPTCLDDIPNIKLSRDEAALSAVNDPESARFEAEIDCVAAWEEKLQESSSLQTPLEPIFINHTFTEDQRSVPTTSTIKFQALVRYNNDTGVETEDTFPVPESWPPFVVALGTKKSVSMLSTLNATNRGATKTRRRKADTYNDLADGGDAPAVPSAKRRKRDSTKQRPRRSLRCDEDENDADIASYIPLKRNRMTQLLRVMTEEEKYKVAVAVVTVRTLIGGLEKSIDWRLVCRLIPEQEEQLLRDAWKSMSNRYRSDIADLTESLQHRYLTALVDDQVPSVNFDSVHDTNWEGILEWGLKSLDKTIVKKIEDLPATREQMLQRNDYVFAEFRGMRDMLGYNLPQTMPRKEEAMSSTIFGEPLQDPLPGFHALSVKIHAMAEETDVELARAKSWIMATLLTPANLFDTQRIQAKLLRLAATPREVESLLERAIKSLQRDKLVSRSQRIMGIGKGNSRSQTDRLQQYEPSAKFFEQFDFRRMITATMLKRAAKYKIEVLDTAFEKDKDAMITLSKDAILDDGEMVAIFNLFAAGMLHIRPGNDIPASRWGLQWQKHGYTTRLVDKVALGFSINISPVKDSYVFGDPLASKRYSDSARVPRGEIDNIDNLGRIPLWFDILHTFQTGLWEMVLAAVLGLVSTRPGIDDKELARTLWFGASIGEVNMVLEWAERLELVRRTQGGTDGGWESRPWWWLGLGSGGGWKVN